MKKKFLNKAFIMILSGMLAALSAMPVSAASLLDKVESFETDADFAEDTGYGTLRGNYLNFGTTNIKRLSSNEINIFGITQGHCLCDTMYLSLYLERKVNGTYTTYKTWDFTLNNATALNKNMNVIVPRGYYYRVRGYHAAKEGRIRESATTLTSGVLVK